MNANETSIARDQNSLAQSLDSCKQVTSYMVIIMYPIIGFRQKWRPSKKKKKKKMASFVAENTQDNVFLLLRLKDTFMEFRIEGNKSKEYSTAEKSRH